MKVLGWIGMIVLLSACNNAEPTATTYKNQLTAGNAATGTPAPGGNTGGGDATAGQALFASKSCNACHKTGGIAKDFKTGGPYKVNADSQKLAAGSHPATTFAPDTEGKNLEAYINTLAGGTAATGAGNAANGETLLKANCDTCHTGNPSKLNSFITSIAGQETQAYHPDPVKTVLNDSKNRDDILAAMKARPGE